MNGTREESSTDDASPVGATAGDDERYGAIEIGNGDVVIYDRDNPGAWLQSDSAVTLGA